MGNARSEGRYKTESGYTYIEDGRCFEKISRKIIRKSAEKSSNNKVGMEGLSKRQKQILACMKQGKSYNTEEAAHMISLKGPRTRQLLNELVAMDLVSCTAATQNRRYIKE